MCIQWRHFDACPPHRSACPCRAGATSSQLSWSAARFPANLPCHPAVYLPVVALESSRRSESVSPCLQRGLHLEGELLQARQQIQARLKCCSRERCVMRVKVLQQSCDSERRLKQAAEQRCEAITRDLNQCASSSCRRLSCCCLTPCCEGIEIKWPSCAKIRTERRL